MILASGEGQLVFLVIMAVIGLINWIMGKLNAGDKKAPPDPSQPGGGPAPQRRANAGSEEERMRRFLEALGVPTEQAPPRPRTEQRPVPPIVAPPPLQTAPRRQVRPTTTPPPLQPQHRASSPGGWPTPLTRVEKIALPDLAVPSVPEFETISSKISAAPMEFPAAREEVDRRPGPNMGEALRAALASPQQLRSAFILSEIFGTPPGLRQS